MLQRQATGQATPTSVPPVVHEVLRSPGQPLDTATRTFFESRFGQDFSQVRVHAKTRPTKLAVSQPNDPAEREADRVADRVLRMPGSASTVSAGPFSGVGTTRVRDGFEPVPSESQFSKNFGDVRIHTDVQAAEAAHSINALAFTVGDHIVFGHGCFSPSNNEGRRVLAHELVHVVQQSTGTKGTAIQRTLQVEHPRTQLPRSPRREHWEEIRDSMAILSPDFTVASSGRIAPANARVCNAPTRVTEICLCDMHAEADPPWKIKVDDSSWPHTEEANRRVTVQSTRSGIDLGAWATGPPGGQRAFLEQWRVLAHELCGHAHLMVQGIHPSGSITRRRGRIMGRPSHDPTVRIENAIAQEVAGPTAPQRGLHADPHSGESFGRVTVSRFASGDHTIPAGMQSAIDRIENFMTSEPLLKADIIGHADNTGTVTVNNRISRRRAREVRDALVAKGIARTRFNVVTGRGTTECTSVGDDPACRKVEVFMYIFESASERFP